MEDILKFFIELGKLKRMPRRGWVINQIKNPESIAEHIFRAAIIGWILGRTKKIHNEKKIIKMALIHDLCEIYAGDTTPYDTVLPKDKKKLKKLMRTWPRFSNHEKRKMAIEKHRKEERALKKLILRLPYSLKTEIKNLWMDYEKRLTPEGRFFHQADRLENFLQAYEYRKLYHKPPLRPWWLWAREFFDDHLLLQFMEVLEAKFHKRKIQKKLKSFLNLLEFFSEIGKLKRIPRESWIPLGVKDSESIADHTFRMTLMAWVLGKETGKLDLEKIIKTALIHCLARVAAADEIIPQKKNYQKSRIDKRKSPVFRKFVIGLPFSLKKELINYWNSFQKGLTREDRFVQQVSRLENLLQVWECYKINRKIPIRIFWEKTKQFIDEPILIKFSQVLEKKF